MAQDKVLFTKAMAKDYTILIPMMAPIHFELIRNVFQNSRYNVELLKNVGPTVVEEGLKYVHNDTCYPALLVIGQMIDALKSKKYDLNKTALIITQTGGGCRASNYLFLLRKALKKADLGHIPVISLNFSGLDQQPGFKLTISLLRRMLVAIVYGDLLMDLSNQVRPYEEEVGATDHLVEEWIIELSSQLGHHQGCSVRQLRKNLKAISQSFEKIPYIAKDLVKVGIVGEIYIKYSGLGNNNLEAFLASQQCEVKVPGMFGFLMYSVYNSIVDDQLYGGNKLTLAVIRWVYQYFTKLEKELIASFKNTRFQAPASFQSLIGYAQEVISLGTKMGEGWLLTGEMMELNHSGFKNIVCTQPFGCLPNHIVGKGMIRKLRTLDPDCNIVAIDYDPSATQVNQENRIKLMLSIAKEKLEIRQKSEEIYEL